MLSALTAIDDGALPTAMANVVTPLVAVFILVTVFDAALVTSSRVPSGVNARLLGLRPTLILATCP